MQEYALLFGVPVDYAEFSESVPVSDWLSKFSIAGVEQVDHGRVLAERWDSEYFPLVAQPLQKLAAFAASINVDVRRRASLSTLKDATKTRRVVIVFAHWKGHELLNDDLVQSVLPDEFQKRVQADASNRCVWLQARLEKLLRVERSHLKSILKTVFGQREHDRPSLRDILAEFIASYPEDDVPEEQFVNVVIESKMTRLARNRDYIDSLFQGMVRPGNRLELFDGLHGKEAVEASVVASFDGVLDLTTCISTTLADYIDRLRRPRMRTVQFETVREFLWDANCVSLALKLCHDQELPYQQARLLAATLLEQAIRAESFNSM